jgi:hypothetical protein
VCVCVCVLCFQADAEKCVMLANCRSLNLGCDPFPVARCDGFLLLIPLQRWNCNADDPNRGFKTDVERPRDECVALMDMLDRLRSVCLIVLLLQLCV